MAEIISLTLLREVRRIGRLLIKQGLADQGYNIDDFTEAHVKLAIAALIDSEIYPEILQIAKECIERPSF